MIGWVVISFWCEFVDPFFFGGKRIHEITQIGGDLRIEEAYKSPERNTL